MWARQVLQLTTNADIAPALATPARADVLAGFEASYGASPIGATVVRCRGQMLQIDSATGDIIHTRLTMYVGDNNDVQRGPNANDNSFDQLSENRDFFFFEPFIFGTTGGTVGTDQLGRSLDVRSSRKLEELNQTLVLDYSAAGVNNPAIVPVIMNLDISLLLMLP